MESGRTRAKETDVRGRGRHAGAAVATVVGMLVLAGCGAGSTAEQPPEEPAEGDAVSDPVDDDSVWEPTDEVAVDPAENEAEVVSDPAGTDGGSTGDGLCARVDETPIVAVIGEIDSRDFSPDTDEFVHRCSWVGFGEVQLYFWYDPSFHWMTQENPIDEYEPVTIAGLDRETYRGFFDSILIEGPGGMGIQAVLLVGAGYEDEQQAAIVLAGLAAAEG